MRSAIVAGVGNIFLGDDGFGVEVARRLSKESLPDGTVVMDVGIRILHLAYELAGGLKLLVLVDAVRQGGDDRRGHAEIGEGLRGHVSAP